MVVLDIVDDALGLDLIAYLQEVVQCFFLVEAWNTDTLAILSQL